MVLGIVFDRVLSIGINYVGTEAQLDGCLNDCINLKNATTSKSHIIMSEVANNDELKPTKRNIITQIKKFTSGVKPGMNLLFQYSGHGSYTHDDSRDEDDGRDETICPLDYPHAGDIKDDELRKLLVNELPNGCTLWCFMDCCHSGTVLDLKHNYQLAPIKGRKGRRRKIKYAIRHSNKIAPTKCQVICFSGCLDTQTSADAHIGGKYQGAMTWGILATISTLRRKGTPLTYRNIMRYLLRVMRNNGFDQIPQISTGKPLDLDTLFTPAGLKKSRAI
jgi:hypothetical protein